MFIRSHISGAASRVAERWLSGQLRQSGLFFLLSLTMATFNALMMVGQCWLLASLISKFVIDRNGISSLYPSLLILPVVMIIRAGLDVLRQGFAFETAARIRQLVREALLEHISILGPSWLQQQRTGSVASTLSEGIEAIQTYFSDYLPQKIVIGIVPLVILTALFPYDWVSGLIMLITAPLIPLFMILVGKGAEKISLKQWDKLRLMSAHFFDMISGLTTLRQANAARRQVEIIAAISENYRQTTMKVLRVAFLSSLVLEFFATISTAMVAVFVGFRLYYGELVFLPGLFALLLVPEFFRPLRELGSHYHARMDAIGATEGLLTILNTRPAITEHSSTAIPVKFSQVINIENVSYRHKEGGGVENISLSLKRGEKLAIIGSSGAGKTTLARLLLGFIKPDSGRILVDGLDMSEIYLPAWQKNIGWLPQRPTLFAGTIKDNICLAQPDAGIERLHAAAKIAHADTFIETLPNTYNFQVGEGGRGLSGGQIQRIAMARAVFTMPNVLILDEPTASLDSDTIQNILGTLDEELTDAAQLLITHDTRVAFRADNVLVMAHGKIIESGSPHILLHKGGAFSALVQLQGEHKSE